MADALALKQILSIQNAAWIAVALLFLFIVRMWNGAPAMLETWILWQQSKSAEKVSDWSRLREEIRRLSDSERECRERFDSLHRRFIEREEAHHREIAELRSEVGELRGYLTGQGKASQEAAGVVALERSKRKPNQEE